MTMQEIIDRLKEWKENTDIDIKSEWISEAGKQDYIRQSITLAMCIGMLENLGENNNIN